MPDDGEFTYKSIRDPLYGYIGISKTELGLINTPVFRRLHHIKQLSFTRLPYPSATHTRYEHSLGVMHMAGKMYDTVDSRNVNTARHLKNKKLVRIAALLHDIGHGPFSHTFESVLSHVNRYKHGIHEKIGLKIMETDDDIGKHIEDIRPMVMGILGGVDHRDNPSSILSEIVSSNLDADKLDYFARDSYHLGVKYGVVDTVRILHLLQTDRHSEHIGIHHKGFHVIDSYRLARYLIATQIYTHHTRLAADQMFIKATQIAFDTEHTLSREQFNIDSESFLDHYKTLNDYTFFDHMVSSDGAVSRQILLDIEARNLLKPCFNFSPKDIRSEKTKEELLSKEHDLKGFTADTAKSLKLQDHELILYKSDIPIKLFNAHDILFLDDERNIITDQRKPLIHADERILKYYVFGRADKRKQIQEKFSGTNLFS